MNTNTLTKVEQEVKLLRKKGLSYNKIGEKLGFSKQKADDICNRLRLNNMIHEKNCPECGEIFKTKNIQKRFCSEQCRKNHHNKHRSPKRKCGHCDNEYRSYQEKEHCTLECREVVHERKGLLIRLIKAIDPARRKRCTHCNEGFYAVHLNFTCCSEVCKKESYLLKERKYGALRREKSRVYYNHKCRECGKHYTDTIKNSAGCSDECKNRYSNRINETNRRHTLRRNGRIDWDISVERLAKRDVNNCYLCDTKVNFSDYIYDSNNHFIAGDYYPSIDHVIPVSKGGTHTWDNVKLAHRICNTHKSDREENGAEHLELV